MTGLSAGVYPRSAACLAGVLRFERGSYGHKESRSKGPMQANADAHIDPSQAAAVDSGATILHPTTDLLPIAAIAAAERGRLSWVVTRPSPARDWRHGCAVREWVRTLDSRIGPA